MTTTAPADLQLSVLVASPQLEYVSMTLAMQDTTIEEAVSQLLDLDRDGAQLTCVELPTHDVQVWGVRFDTPPTGSTAPLFNEPASLFAHSERADQLGDDCDFYTFYGPVVFTGEKGTTGGPVSLRAKDHARLSLTLFRIAHVVANHRS